MVKSDQCLRRFPFTATVAITGTLPPHAATIVRKSAKYPTGTCDTADFTKKGKTENEESAST